MRSVSFFCFFLSSCTGAAVLKTPVQERCESAGLKGCPAMADGVVLYVDGKQAEGTQKIKAGAAANNPEEVREFAKLLAGVTSLPGVSQYAGPVNQIATLLATEADNAPPPVPGQTSQGPSPQGNKAATAEVAGTGETISASDETPSIPPTMVEAAPDDMGRVVTESLAVWSSKQKCWLAGQEMPCSQVRQGPFVVTDVIALPECTDSIYVGASLAAEESQRSGRVGFRWVVRAGHPGIHGARLVVKAGESLLVAISSSEGHVVEYPKCIATWSGYGPDRNPYRQ